MNNNHLYNLYLKAKSQLNHNEHYLAKEFSYIILKECYGLKKLIQDLETLLKVNEPVTQIP